MEAGLQIYQRKKITKAIALLERARSCDERAQNARWRSGHHPGTATAQRERELRDRWDARADKAWGEAMVILQDFAGVAAIAEVA